MSRNLTFSTATLMLLLAGLTGCSFVTPFERPSVDVPAAWSVAPKAAAAPASVAVDWWRRFGSPELDRLVAEALVANQDLAAALARIEQARAGTRVAGASLLPGVEGSASASRSRSASKNRSHTANSDKLALTASYEADLWGRNAAARQSAEAALTASIFDKAALALVVQAEVASTYFEAVAFRRRLAIARDNLDLARQVLRMVEIQLQQGAATALDLARQRAAVASFEAQLPLLEQQLQSAQTALAVLLGRVPGSMEVEVASFEALTLPAITVGQPSDLLERRPDIRSVEADLLAANADIGAARAAFYPSVTLSASAAFDGLATGGTSTVTSVAAGLVAPIFSGGRLEGGLDRVEARQRELAASYRQTVLTAFKEVQDTLETVEASAARSGSLAIAADEAREALRLARISYGAGAADFLTVLDAQRTLLDSEDSLVQAELDRYATAADLFKALGGGWDVGI